MFYLERYDGKNWTAFRVSTHMVSPSDIIGIDGYPSSTTPGNLTTFAGKPGWKCRIRYDDVTIEEFDWAEIPENPMDADSMRLWGWKPISRNYAAIPKEVKQAYPLPIIGFMG